MLLFCLCLECSTIIYIVCTYVYIVEFPILAFPIMLMQFPFGIGMDVCVSEQFQRWNWRASRFANCSNVCNSHCGSQTGRRNGSSNIKSGHNFPTQSQSCTAVLVALITKLIADTIDHCGSCG